MRAPGHDLVPAAALRLGALRDEPSSRSSARRSSRSRSCWSAPSGSSTSASSIPAHGGDPVLFQHLFWFYSHPAVYIMILPAMGVISELVTALRAQAHLRLQVHRRVLESRSRSLGFLVWGHHMFVSGQSVYAGLVFSILSFMVGDPLGDQGLQLDGDAVQGLDLVPDADALRARLHRPLHDRRADGALPRDARPRRPRARHVLHRRALPLHHGGRHDHGATWAGSTTGGRRSPASSTRSTGRASRRSSSSSAST